MTTKWSPASCTASTVHPTQVSAPSRTGAPEEDGDQRTTATLAAPAAALVPKIRASPRWSAASTLAQKCPDRAIRGHVADDRLGLNSTSGGTRDTAAKDWQANPAGPPESHTVMTVTPVQKWPSTWRNRRGSGSNAVGVTSGAAVIQCPPATANRCPHRLTEVVSRLTHVASSTSLPSVPYSMSNPPGVAT